MPLFEFLRSRMASRPFATAPTEEVPLQAEPWMGELAAILEALQPLDMPVPPPTPPTTTGSPFGGGPAFPPSPTPPPGATPPGTSPFLTPWEPWRTGTPPYVFSPAPVNQQLV